MTDIERAINIGPVLAVALRRAGIDTVEELGRLGYLAAWQRVQAMVPDRDCVHTCLALAGAVEGVRWTRLPADVRARISAEAKVALA